MIQPISKSASIKLAGLTAAHISQNGQVLTDVPGILKALGYANDLAGLQKRLPALLHKGVQSCPSGVVQDPAGSAVGSGVKPSGGGGSGAIYGHFHDLDPVPSIQPGEAIFNSSTGPGSRVLHSYSPEFHRDTTHLDVNDPDNCQWVLQELANAYLNAYRAKHMVDGTPPTETDQAIFNACPLSGRIFAGRFKNTILNHLDPSYTIPAMLIAQAEADRAGDSLPAITLCYYDAPVYAEGVKVMAAISAA